MFLLLVRILLVLLLVLAGCQERQPLPPLLKVGQRQLSLPQFERDLQSSYPDLGRLSQPDQLLLKKQFVQRLVERELILGEAERLEVRLSPDEMDQALTDLRGSYSSEEFAKALRDAGQTPEAWSAALKLRLLTEKVSRAVLAALPPVSAAEVEAYYRDNREQFLRPAELRARQMLFDSVEDAEKILKRLRDGEDFAGLAREFSLSPDREDGGYLGYFAQGQLPPEFDKVLFTLPTGRVSDPVESPYGIHLFLVESRRSPGISPLPAVAEEIASKLTQQREEEAFQRWLEELRGETPVTIHWELLTPETRNR